MVVVITILLRLRGLCPSWNKVVATISHCALFAFADTGTGTGCTTSRYDEEDADAGSSEEADQGQEQKGVWVCQWVRWRRRLFYGKNGVLAQHKSGSSRHLHSTRQ